jgi:hypothetical protein
MVYQLTKMSSFERPVSLEKERKGLYKSSSLQQNLTKLLEFLFAIVVKDGHAQLWGCVFFSTFHFFILSYMSIVLQG